MATTEIRFGDNDRLAARVAQAAGAAGVILLSDVDGLYDRHPDEPGAVLVEIVAKIDGHIRIMVAEGSSSGMGSGGMASKIDAADIATHAGVRNRGADEAVVRIEIREHRDQWRWRGGRRWGRTPRASRCRWPRDRAAAARFCPPRFRHRR